MENISKTIRETVKNNSSTKSVAVSCGIGYVMTLAVSKSMGIGRHLHIPMPSFDSIIQDLNEYYLDDDFSNHVKVRNENLEYSEDRNESYAYLEVKDLNILIKVTIGEYLSIEIKSLNSGKVIGALDGTKYQYKDFSVVPIEKHIYDMLFYFTMDYYNLYGDEYDDDL